jgi:hypothetical protein
MRDGNIPSFFVLMWRKIMKRIVFFILLALNQVNAENRTEKPSLPAEVFEQYLISHRRDALFLSRLVVLILKAEDLSVESFVRWRADEEQPNQFLAIIDDRFKSLTDEWFDDGLPLKFSTQKKQQFEKVLDNCKAKDLKGCLNCAQKYVGQEWLKEFQQKLAKNQ